MPIRSDLDYLEGVIRTKVTSPVTLEDIRTHLKTLLDSHAYSYSELVDLRDVSGVEGSEEALKSLTWEARNTLGHTPPANRAVVVKGDRALRSARFAAALLVGCVRLGVFEDEDDAERWLEESKAQALPPKAELHPVG